MNYLSKEDLNNLLKISKLLDSNEISQLINLNNKINLNEGNILGSLKKINSNKDLIFKIKEKYDIVENDLEKIKKLVSIFGNDYDIFSYLIKFPNKIDDDSLKFFFKKLSEREEPINYLKKIIEELNTLNGGEDIFLDTYDNMTFKKNKSTNLRDSSEIAISNVDSEDINGYFNFSDTIESDKFTYKDI